MPPPTKIRAGAIALPSHRGSDVHGRCKVAHHNIGNSLYYCILANVNDYTGRHFRTYGMLLEQNYQQLKETPKPYELYALKSFS